VRNVSYKDIQQVVLTRIRTRVWPPGGMIPSENDLAEEFDCARATVNRALRELAETGVLDRKRKAGTRVSLNPVRRATLEIPVIRREVEGRGQAYGFNLSDVELEDAPAFVLARMGVLAGTKLLHLRTLHMADHQPYMYEDRWVNIEVVPEILQAPLSQISANEWLVQNAPYSRGDISLMARNADVVEAEALLVEVGTALFVTERVTWASQKAITFVHMAYPPGYQMHSEL
jgi:GntR family transcriptional regulator, histidine utilization repressor